MLEIFAPILDELFKHTAEIVLLFLLAFGSAILSRLKNWWKDHSKKKLQTNIVYGMHIRELLSELRGAYDCDRVAILQFHNGEYYLSGESNMKLSMTDIVMKTGVAYPLNHANGSYSSIPVMHYLACLENLQKNPTYFRGSQDSFEDPFLRHVCAQSGAKSALFTPVKDVRGNWIALLGISWLEEIEQPETDTLLAYSKTIGNALSKRF